MEEKKSKEQLAKEFTDKLNQLKDLDEVERMIKDNKIEFELDGKIYRVRKPSFKEKNQLERLRSLKKQELVLDDAYKFRRQWIDLYKTKGIDIEKLDKEITELSLKIEDLKLQIGGTDSIEAKKRFSKEVEQLRTKTNSLIIEKSDYLEYSIEDVLTDFSNVSLIALVLEKKEENKWTEVFKDYDELMNSNNDKLIALATNYLRAIIFYSAI